MEDGTEIRGVVTGRRRSQPREAPSRCTVASAGRLQHNRVMD